MATFEVSVRTVASASLSPGNLPREVKQWWQPSSVWATSKMASAAKRFPISTGPVFLEHW